MHKLKFIEAGQPLNQAKKALIALHGRGGRALDILALAKTLTDETFYLVAPEAQNNSWYPYSFMSNDPENTPWIDSSVEIVHQLITKIELPEIYLMGFSQGACLALETCARHPKKYGGIIAFSGGLIGPTLKKYPGNLDGTKIFIGISENDPHIPLQRAKDSYELLNQMGGKATLKIYEGSSHTITKEEINGAKKLLTY